MQLMSRELRAAQVSAAPATAAPAATARRKGSMLLLNAAVKFLAHKLHAQGL